MNQPGNQFLWYISNEIGNISHCHWCPVSGLGVGVKLAQYHYDEDVSYGFLRCCALQPQGSMSRRGKNRARSSLLTSQPANISRHQQQSLLLVVVAFRLRILKISGLLVTPPNPNTTIVETNKNSFLKTTINVIFSGYGQWQPDLPSLPSERLQAGCPRADLQMHRKEWAGQDSVKRCPRESR